MSIWKRIAQALARLAPGERLSALLARLGGEPERSVAFTIAVVALGAKIAKADGRVSRDEVKAFRQVFTVDPADEAQVARVYNLAREDTAGFEAYARTIARLFRGNAQMRRNVLEGLFHIAVADGGYHPAEDEFLQRVGEIFEMDPATFARLRNRFVPGAPLDPHEVLGVAPGTPLPEIRKAWRAKIRETHPDRVIAAGMPAEAVAMATRRVAELNAAWEALSRGTPAPA